MTIKTFKGLMRDDTQDTLVLHTNDGSTGYRIVKFQIIPKTPGTVGVENVCKIYKTFQTTIDGEIDLSDTVLLACAYYQDSAAATDSDSSTIIFDNEIFNQDIYVTHKDVSGNAKECNYYIELEQMKLDLNENTVATLKDIRNLA